MDLRESIQRQFGAAAENYAVSAVHMGGENLDALLGAAPLDRARVLDIGCGTGHTTLAIAERGARVTGLDLTEAMLEQARALAAERGIEVDFRRGDAAELPFPDAFFDVVTCRFCAHHFTHPERVVRETARVLVPGGVFLLVDSVSPDDPAQDTFENAFELLRDPSHVRNHRASEWRQMFADAGLAPELLDTWDLEIEFASWIERMRTPAVAVDALRWLFSTAPAEARSAFSIAENGDFTLPTALLRGRKG